jgi:RHS repeat-associated protein
VTDPLGRTTTITYDDLDRMKTIKDASGAVTTNKYDENGNQISITDALNQKWTNVYDPMNRLIARTDPLDRTSRMRYNTAGEMTATISPSGRTNTYQYDARGQRTAMIDGMSGIVRFSYDAQKNMLALTDQRGNTTTFNYDELYRVVGRRDPVGKITTFEYDADGDVLATVDRLGRRTTVTYDPLNRREQVNYVDAVVKYAYDAAGRLKRIDDTQADGALEWAYDDANRLLSEITAQGVVKYTYNNASQRASMNAVDRPPVTYTYDTVGRLRTIAQSAETFTYSYDTLSRQTRLDRPNGVKTENAYDEVNRLKRLTHTNAAGIALEDFQYSYNADDEIEATGSLASANLLPTAKEVGQADTANRTLQFGLTDYTFDTEGQVRTKTEIQGTSSYEWDARGRLSQVKLPNGQTITYVYDAKGRRTSRSSNGLVTSFTYDGLDRIFDRRNDGKVSDYLTHLLIDKRLKQTDSLTGTSYFLQDHLGSISILTDGLGNTVGRIKYEAFGGSTNFMPIQFSYTGRESEEQSGLIYYRARWYNPELGKFISEDPIGLADGLNLYSYVRNNPINRIDPLGTSSIDCTNSSPKCGDYSPCDQYSGSNAQCFCRCAGNDPWSLYVRCCLRGYYEQGYSPNTAHLLCYAEATAIFGASRIPGIDLLICFIKCRREQKERCCDWSGGGGGSSGGGASGGY